MQRTAPVKSSGTRESGEDGLEAICRTNLGAADCLLPAFSPSRPSPLPHSRPLPLERSRVLEVSDTGRGPPIPVRLIAGRGPQEEVRCHESYGRVHLLSRRFFLSLSCHFAFITVVIAVAHHLAIVIIGFTCIPCQPCIFTNFLGSWLFRSSSGDIHGEPVNPRHGWETPASGLRQLHSMVILRVHHRPTSDILPNHTTRWSISYIRGRDFFILALTLTLSVSRSQASNPLPYWLPLSRNGPLWLLESGQRCLTG